MSLLRWRRLILNRGALGEPLEEGELQLLAALPELLERPARTKGKGNKLLPAAERIVREALTGRRTDFLAGFIRLIAVLLNHVSFKTWFVYSGDHAIERRRPMGVLEMARRAAISRRSCSTYLACLRRMRIIDFEKAKRKQTGGTWRTQGPHYRRINPNTLRALFDPGYSRDVFDRYVKRAAKEEVEAAAPPTTAEQIEERLTEFRGRLKAKPNASDRHWLELQIAELAGKLERLRAEPVRNAVRGALDDAAKRSSWKAPALGVKLAELSDAERRALYDAVAEARPDLRTLADIQAEAVRWLDPPTDGSPTN